MNSEQLRQLSELLSSVNAVNGGKNQLRLRGAFVEDENGAPLVELGVNAAMDLVVVRIIQQNSDVAIANVGIHLGVALKDLPAFTKAVEAAALTLA